MHPNTTNRLTAIPRKTALVHNCFIMQVVCHRCIDNRTWPGLISGVPGGAPIPPHTRNWLFYL